MKNLIKNILKEKVSKKSNKLIYETESELDEQGRPPLYTDEYIIQTACNYTNAREFRQNHPNLYQASISRKEKLLPHIKEVCNYEDLGNLVSRTVYVFVWYDLKAVYYGLTVDFRRRTEQHQVDPKSSVYQFISEHGPPDAILRVIQDYIPAQSAATLEKCLIKLYQDINWNVINGSSGGELGYCGTGVKRSLVDDVKKVLDANVKTREELKNFDPDIEMFWSKQGRQQLFNQQMGSRVYSRAKYDINTLKKIASEFKTSKEFENGNHNAWLAAKARNLLKYWFPQKDAYYSRKTNKTYNNLFDLLKDDEDIDHDDIISFYEKYNEPAYRDKIFKFPKENTELLNSFIKNDDQKEINESKSLIKSILKEESKNLEKEKKGIDLTIKMLKKSYPYIIGWKYSEEHPESPVYINIDIICDIKKTKEFYNSDLKWYYKKNPENIKEDDYAYPFTILEIGEKMTSEEKFEEHRKFRKQLNEIYEMLPENLIILSKWGEPKEIDPDKYFFE
jgi:predicted GIY-YIG superfamily endonuclease